MKYVSAFMIQMVIIGMATNIRTDIPFWKQITGYAIIALIFPLSLIVEDYTTKSAKKAVKENDSSQ